MKRILLLAFIFSAVAQFNFAQSGANIEFAEEKHAFGELDEGPKVSHEFVFTNTGTEPLILSKVKASCGCTTPSWPKEPVLPGEEGTILVTYNTAKRVGGFNKSITITSNAVSSPSKVLYISGSVIAVPDEETMPIKQPSMMSPTN